MTLEVRPRTDGDRGDRVDEAVAHRHDALHAAGSPNQVAADGGGLRRHPSVTTPSFTMTEYQLGSERPAITWLMIS